MNKAFNSITNKLPSAIEFLGCLRIRNNGFYNLTNKVKY